MQILVIIGNVVGDPQTRTTQSGHTVCSFSVAVNRRHQKDGQQEADFFRVSAWNQLGENCQKYLTKGKKVEVTGTVSVSTYTAKDGTVRANMDVLARDVEFLSPKEQTNKEPMTQDSMSGYVEVDEEGLPF